MTDRANALLVTLDQDMRVDDLEDLVKALRQFRHVIDVTPNVSNFTDHIAESRARDTLRSRIIKALMDPIAKDGQ